MKIGESNSEIEVKRIQESRDIVKKIIEFGVTEQHKIDIIHFLSLELENNQLLKDINKILKKFRLGIKPDEESEYDNKGPDDSNKLLGV